MKHVRSMAAADLKAVARIEAAAFADAWGEQLLVQELNNSLAHYFVLEEDEKVLAYAGFWLVAAEAQIMRVAVCPAERGRGYGAAIMNAVINRAWELGAEAMTLEVRTSNLTARKLYRSCGFATMGVRLGYYADNGESAIIMWLYRRRARHE